ncbi:hypothetical protein J3L16_13280 [Alteromonas sp. 5E99-2]|uniref:hypothetical protein n=1 Tax=Alteromonas sp. 5E99-2 TaxID=2817683 RepID=UPI001A98775C|nr:hypothetical protein [Alteromonas sp. 5E99-2]MBO1256658.1 hypothetical protein [Alteromonas sp. 5E99-2]
MDNETENSEEVVKKQRGRRKKGVSADNIHEIVDDLSNGDYLNKDRFRYEMEPREKLLEITEKLALKGYRKNKSPAAVKSRIEQYFEELAKDGITEEKESDIKERIKTWQDAEFKADESDIKLLQEAIDALGPDFWRRYQAKKRQAKHKRNSSKRKRQIPIDSELFDRLSIRKDKNNWDEYLLSMKVDHDILRMIMLETHSSSTRELVTKLEAKGILREGFMNRHWITFSH